MPNQQEIDAEVARREKNAIAERVENTYGTQQRELWKKVLGLKVFDLIEFDDVTSDSIILQMYVDPKTRDLIPGQKVLCQVFILSPKTTKVWLTQATFKKDGLYDSDDEKLIPKLQAGAYVIF